MGKYRRLEDILNDAAPQYSNIHLLPVSVPLYLDPQLKGEARFSRKIGSGFGMLNPDVSVRITQATKAKEVTFRLERLLSWYELGSIVTLGIDEEFNILSDFREEEKIFFVDLEEPVVFPYEVDDQFNLYATPIPVLGEITTGDSVIRVRSRYELMQGDQIVILQLDGNLNSRIEFDVEIANFLATDPAEPEGYIFSYELTLDKPMTRGFAISDTVFLRANPAYTSRKIIVPFIPNSITPVGPFLLDYISGRLIQGNKVEEFLSFEFFTSDGNALNALPIEGEKNYPITNTPISSDFLLFFKKLQGSMTFQDNKFKAICDDNGHFAVVNETAPAWRVGTKWNFNVLADADATLRVRFHPNEYVDYVLPSNVNTNVVVGTEAFQSPIEKLEIVVISQAGATVLFSGWQTDDLKTAVVKYHILGRISGLAPWQASGLILKPYFLSLEYMKARYDEGRKYDSGLIYDFKG